MSVKEKAELLFMREEEKLARDTYHTLFEKYGLTVFTNIESSEQSHMDALLKLLEKYRLADPAAGALIGEFKDPELQDIYDHLITWGEKSALDALLVGGLIEETDMEDSMAAMQRAQQANTYETTCCAAHATTCAPSPAIS